MTEETLDQVSDSELFSKAMAPEAPPAEESAPESVTEEAPAERARDEKGRFAAAQQEAAPEAATEQPEAEDIKPGFNIPSWRLKEEADARREAEARLRQFQDQISQYEKRIQELTPKPEPRQFPDFFAEPEQLQTYIQNTLDEARAEWQKEHRATVANLSMQRAHDKYGDQFIQAFQDITARPMDDPVRQQIINSPDPGDHLVKLWKREQTIAQVGDDPNAYVQQKLEEALNDPQFLAKALEKARSSAGAQPSQRIDMPASLNKGSGTASHTESGSMSDAHLFRQAMAGKR